MLVIFPKDTCSDLQIKNQSLRSQYATLKRFKIGGNKL